MIILKAGELGKKSATITAEGLPPNEMVNGPCRLIVCPLSVQDNRFLCQHQRRQQCDAPTPPLPATQRQRRTTRATSSRPKKADTRRRKGAICVKLSATHLRRHGFILKISTGNNICTTVDLTEVKSYDEVPVHAVDMLLHNNGVFHCHVTISGFPQN